MRLTAFSDVSLRVLMLLSALEPGQKLSTQKIAEGVDTPYNHVAKAVAFLVNQGYLDSTRGRSGGVMLSESGRSVTVGTILRATEGDIPMIECEDENGHCPLDKFCRLRNVLARAREAFYAAVDSVIWRLGGEPCRLVPGRLLGAVNVHYFRKYADLSSRYKNVSRVIIS